MSANVSVIGRAGLPMLGVVALFATISPEIALEAPVHITVASSEISGSAVGMAADGTQAVVAWTDWRTKPIGNPRSDNGDTQIVAARVRADGTLVDPTGILITRSHGVKLEPKVAFDGVNFLIAWRQGGGIYATRMTPEGTLLEPNGVSISPPGSLGVTLAASPSEFLVLWRRLGNLEGMRMPDSGPLTPGNVFQLSTTSFVEWNPAATWGNDHYEVLWEEADTVSVHRARIARSGSITSSVLASDAKRPAVTYGGGHFLYAWNDDGFSEVSVRVDEGAAQRLGAGSFPAAGFDGSLFHVGYASYRPNEGNEMRRVAPDGSFPDPEPIALMPQSYTDSAIACPGTSCLLAVTALGDIQGVRLPTASAGAGVPFKIDRTASWQFGSRAIAGPHGGYLVVWRDNRDDPAAGNVRQAAQGPGDLYAVRVDACGRVLDPVALHVQGTAQSYAVAATATKYFVLSQKGAARSGESLPLEIRAIDAATGAMDAAIPIAPSTRGDQTPALACRANGCFLGWHGPDAGGGSDAGSPDALYTARIDEQGAFIGTPVRVRSLSAAKNGGFPLWISAAVNDSSTYALTWTDQATYFSPTESFAVRVDAETGAVRDPTPLSLTTAMKPWSAERVSLVSNGADFLVTAANSDGVRGARFTSAGVLLDANGISIRAGASTRASVTRMNGAGDYFVAWEDLTDPTHGIRGAQVSGLGVVTPREEPLVTDEFDLAGPYLASHADGAALLAYDRFDPSNGFSSRRARARVLDAPSPEHCTVPDAGSDAGAPDAAAPDAASNRPDAAPPPSAEPGTGDSSGCSIGEGHRDGGIGSFVTIALVGLALRRRRFTRERGAGERLPP